jgi:hypothetical protein
MVGALARELNGQLGDPQIEVVDQGETDLGVGAPGLRDRETVEQLTPGVPEQIR